MSLIFEERLSDSPYVESVTWGRTLRDDCVVRPAEQHWHMVVVRTEGRTLPIVVGPLPAAGVASWREGAEILWIKFKLGTCMPHLPARNVLDAETALPEATCDSFWLNGSVWQFPNHENVETFITRLVRKEILVRDPVVCAALQDPIPDISPRTLRHRFLQTTGLSQNAIYQIERARRAETLLRQGHSISDAIYELGYFDQPHLTRALKRYVGKTPGEIRLAISYKTPAPA